VVFWNTKLRILGLKREEMTRENYIMKRTDVKRWSNEET
jgi:hypothetical protein